MAETYTTAPAPQPNIAETLARVLPTAALLHPQYPGPGDILRIAVPKTFDIKEIDTEALLPTPRRTSASAAFADAESFLAYVKRHAKASSTVAWCNFNPQTFALGFTAVIDDHGANEAGWRAHKAAFAPDMSAEWKAWKGANKNPFDQVPFAEWIQEHEEDIAAANGLPTSLQMLAMATEFVANEEHALKSAVRLQSGGVRLTYIADPDKGTTEDMKLFEKFALGIPVFHGDAAWSLTARLKYRITGGKVKFHYELVRPDRVHEHAALELIGKVREGLGGVPLLMGACA
jgi:uncharacterized protein YfdQ (DUF2303 family)